MDTFPFQFIGQQIQVFFDKPPLLEKTPDCPAGFDWQGETYHIVAVLAEWWDFERKGRYANNMRPEHAATARVRGSWGVGRYYFRVQVEGERFFELYYDRAPGNVNQRKGNWYLVGERRKV